MAGRHQLGLDGMVDAIARCVHVGDQAAVTIGLLRLGLFECDLRAGQQGPEGIYRGNTAAGCVFLLRLRLRWRFYPGKADLTAVIQDESATVDDARRRALAYGFAAAARVDAWIFLPIRAPPAARRRQAGRTNRHDRIPPAHYGEANGRIAASLRQEWRSVADSI
jgi:hypothetical protein